MPHYVRSHGLGNDYLVIDPDQVPVKLTPRAVRLICDRHLGVGSDGILALAPSRLADFGMRIHNPDGSEAEKSGNGIRIFAKFLREHGYADRDAFAIETPGGVVKVELRWRDGRVAEVFAEMGRATFGSITKLDVEGRSLEVTTVSMGNPHCVVLVDDLAVVDVSGLGAEIEQHPVFPDRTNVQFAQVISRGEVRAEIWERGAGYTLASGSSSCAVAAAAHRADLVDGEVTVSMPGGQLLISIQPNWEVRMLGPAEEISVGDLSPDLLRLLPRRARSRAAAKPPPPIETVAQRGTWE